MTSHLVLSLYYRSHVPPNAPGVGEGLRGVVWILSAKSARCTGRRRVGGGPWVGAR